MRKTANKSPACKAKRAPATRTIKTATKTGKLNASTVKRIVNAVVRSRKAN